MLQIHPNARTSPADACNGNNGRTRLIQGALFSLMKPGRRSP
jgi:hypothetical protein